jgi:hypothetical protein
LTRRRDLLRGSVAVLAALPVLAAITYSIIAVLTNRLRAPFWDMVPLEIYINERVLSHGFDLRAALTFPDNEHRPVFPMIFWIIDHVLFNSDGLFLIIVNLLLITAIATMVGRMALRAGVPFVPALAFLLLVPLAMLWPANWENLIWPKQVHVLLAVAAISGGFIGLVRADDLLRRSGPPRAIFVSVALGLALFFVGMFSFGYGLVAWGLTLPLILVRSWHRRLRMSVFIVITVIIVAGLALYGSTYTIIGAHADPLQSVIRPFDLLSYVIMFMGAPAWFIVEGLGGTPRDIWPALAGTAGISTFGAAIVLMLKPGKAGADGAGAPARLFFVCIAIWTVGVALLTALVRVNLSSPSGISRYLIVPTLFWLALGGWSLSGMRSSSRASNGAFLFGAVATACILVATFPYYFGIMQDRARLVRMAAISAVLKMPGALTGYILAGNDDALISAFMDESARRGASIYRQAWPGWLGRNVHGMFGASESGRCDGFVDQIMPLADEGIRAVGWAWDARKKVALQWLLITDMNGKVVGLATSGVARPDVSAYLHQRSASRSGWEGFARVSTSDFGSVYAVLNDGHVCRLRSLIHRKTGV